jgi:hypothetical protein
VRACHHPTEDPAPRALAVHASAHLCPACRARSSGVSPGQPFIAQAPTGQQIMCRVPIIGTGAPPAGTIIYVRRAG